MPFIEVIFEKNESRKNFGLKSEINLHKHMVQKAFNLGLGFRNDQSDANELSCTINRRL